MVDHEDFSFENYGICSALTVLEQYYGAIEYGCNYSGMDESEIDLEELNIDGWSAIPDKLITGINDDLEFFTYILTKEINGTKHKYIYCGGRNDLVPIREIDLTDTYTHIVSDLTELGDFGKFILMNIDKFNINFETFTDRDEYGEIIGTKTGISVTVSEFVKTNLQ